MAFQDFLFRVHDERPMVHDRLPYRQAAQQEDLEVGAGGFLRAGGPRLR